MIQEESVFSFSLSGTKPADMQRWEYMSIGKYFVSYSRQTCIQKAADENSELLILGDATNLFTKETDAASLLHEITDASSFVVQASKWGGKYVLLYRKEERYYLLGDATCSIPIHYVCIGGREFFCASNLQDIAKAGGDQEDQNLLKMRRGGSIDQAMPFDYTIYREIKQLLPNHYLVFSAHYEKTVRYEFHTHEQESLSPKEAADLTFPWIQTLASYYLNKYSVCCPITSGRDSRVVLAFLESAKQVPCYTIKHKESKSNEQDLQIPPQLCRIIGIGYEQLSDRIPNDQVIEEIDQVLGENAYSKRTLMIANTVKEFAKDRAIINGDIIGQVGKCSLHRDIPECLATPCYFMAKIHNHARESKKAIREWLKEINKSQEKCNRFDLFSVENRMGRWAGQENLIYNTIGQKYLNLFNARCIIDAWTRVPRKDRKRALIHRELIKKLNPALLEIPFERDTSFMVSLAKSNGLLYYLFSMAKHANEAFAFLKAERELK